MSLQLNNASFRDQHGIGAVHCSGGMLHGFDEIPLL